MELPSLGLIYFIKQFGIIHLLLYKTQEVINASNTLSKNDFIILQAKSASEISQLQ